MLSILLFLTALQEKNTDLHDIHFLLWKII